MHVAQNKVSGGGRSQSKRNRNLLSCTECHRRKQKCNRELPCNDCTQRNVPQKCGYQQPARTNHGPYIERGLAREARLRRIITGSEVIMTAESVTALQKVLPEDSAISVAQVNKQPYHFDDLIAEIGPSGAIPFLRPSSPQHVFMHPTSMTNPWFLGGLDPFSSTPEVEGSPIPKEKLICHFLQRLAPWLSNSDNSLTPSSPRVSWLPFAINHAPLFYATCLASVVHLDRVQPLGDQSKLLWYKTETMRLANENMSVATEGASDQMIMVALILLYFNVGGGNSEEYEIHLKGIHQMLKVRGGIHRLGMRGMVKSWVDICYGPWNDDWEYGHFLSSA